MRKQKENNTFLLTPTQRIIAVFDTGNKNATQVHRLVNRKVKVSKSKVYDTIQKYQNGQPLERKKRSDCGKTRKITKPQQQRIRQYVNQSQKTSARIIKKQLKLTASESAITKFLKNEGFTYTSTFKVPPLTPVQKQQRILFCQRHINDNMNEAIFVDETSVETHLAPRKTWTLKSNGPKKFVKPSHPQKFHLWGGISVNGTISIEIFEDNLTAKKYLKILKKRLIPWKQKQKNMKNFNFYQDNDPKHRAKSTEKWLEENNINWIRDWPSYSPDLNPIENLWWQLKSQIQYETLNDKQQLRKAIKKFWKSVNPEQCQTLINSWVKRCQQIIQQKGEKIQY
ncbi:hypothetical protein ABPG72_020145 [Tetrahymena utriculariae]